MEVESSYDTSSHFIENHKMIMQTCEYSLFILCFQSLINHYLSYILVPIIQFHGPRVGIISSLIIWAAGGPTISAQHHFAC
jgi:hypothetical protein